jgi:hypothetical protein
MPYPHAKLAGVEGLEPPASGFGDRRSSQLSYTPARRNGSNSEPATICAGGVERGWRARCQEPVTRGGLERVTGIEPAQPAWKAGALPLSYTRTACTLAGTHAAGCLAVRRAAGQSPPRAVVGSVSVARKGARRPVSRVLSVSLRTRDGHSSGTRLAARLSRPTRATGRECPCVTSRGCPRAAAGRPYSVLLPVGFTLPLPLPAARCALTAPFHPCRLGLPPGDRPWRRRFVFCGTFPGVAPAGR